MGQLGAYSQGVLLRERLLDQIDDAGRVVVLRAEGGAGKTTAASLWVRERAEHLVIWVSLSEHTPSALSFWTSVFHATATALDPADARRLLEHFDSIVTAEQAAALFVTTVMQRRTPLTLVIDDLHHAPRDAQDQLVDVTKRIPDLRLVITTRTRTRFETPLSKAAFTVTVIDSASLALTPQEISAVAHLDEEPLSADELAVLGRITRGNALATRLALSAVQGLWASGTTPTLQAVTQAIDAAAAELVPQLNDPAEQRFALALSLCPEIDQSLATELTGSDSGWRFTEQFATAGLGHLSDQFGRAVFRLHPLVQASLRTRAHESFSEHEIRDIQLTALNALRAHADPIDVMALMLDTDSDAQIFPFFAAHFSLLSLQRTAEVVALLDELPRERLLRHPTLASVLVVSLSDRAGIPSPRVLELVELALPRLNRQLADESGMAAAITALARFALLRSAKRYEIALEFGNDFLGAVDALPASEQTSMWGASIMQVMITAILAGEIEQAAGFANRLHTDTHTGRQMHLNSLHAFVLALLGDLPAAKRHMQIVDEMAAPYAGWSGSLYSAGWHLAQAMQAVHDQDPAAGFAALAPLEPILPMLELWVAVIWVRGQLLALTDEPDAAKRFQQQLQQHAGRPRSQAWQRRLDEVQHTLLSQALPTQLTARELTVLTMLAGPHTLGEIADEQFVSPNTLKTQTRSIYRKLDVAGRREAVKRANELGLLPSS